mgnify:CR=1 FL=1
MRLENLFTHLKKELKARQDVTKEAICNNVKDWETYRYMVGRLAGLKEAEQELTDLLKLEKKTKGGIHLTDDTIQESQITTNICKVLKTGSLCYTDKERYPDGPWCKKGDWVIITRYAGSRVKIDGGELRIINEDEILAVVDDPRDILPANIL